jgi:hypothetical protein
LKLFPAILPGATDRSPLPSVALKQICHLGL